MIRFLKELKKLLIIKNKYETPINHTKYDGERRDSISGILYSNTWYGMKEFYVKDINGYILGFAEMGE